MMTGCFGRLILEAGLSDECLCSFSIAFEGFFDFNIFRLGQKDLLKNH
jgi:hypothetical protein